MGDEIKIIKIEGKQRWGKSEAMLEIQNNIRILKAHQKFMKENASVIGTIIAAAEILKAVEKLK